MKKLLSKKNMTRFATVFFTMVFNTLNPVFANTFNLPDPSQSPAAKKSAGGTPGIFFVENTKVAANIYYPSNYDDNKKFSGIVVVAPQGGLKEQTAGIYASKLSKLGYVTLAFDHRSYGQSAGEPRHFESPQWKTEDIKGAVSYMGSIPGIDKDKIGVIAICSGAGYGVLASVQDFRIKALATVSGVFDFRERESGIDGLNKPGPEQIKRFREKMKISAQARQKYFETGVMEYMPLVPDLNSNTSDFWRQGYDYYRTERGFINGWENKRSAHSLEARLSVNTSLMLSGLRDLGTPFLAVAGDQAFTYPFSVAAVERTDGEKELFTIKGAKHFDLYDQISFVEQVVKKLDSFFKKSL